MKINYVYEVTRVVNELQGIRWGKSELTRAMKTCKELYEYFDGSPLREFGSTYDITVCCIRDIVTWLQGQGMNWSIEGAVNKYRGKWEQHILIHRRFKKDIFK